MTRRSLTLPAVSLALLLSACAGGGGDEDDKPLPEDAAARAALLVVSDFPAGWAEEPDEEPDDDPSPFDKCDRDPSPTITGHADTGSFSGGGDAWLAHAVAFFDTPASVQAAFGRVEGFARCLVEVINDGGLDDEDATFADASLSPVSFPSMGERSAAWRVKATVTERLLFGYADFFIDVAAVSRGRYAFSLIAFEVYSPFSPTLLETFARKALAKLPSD